MLALLVFYYYSSALLLHMHCILTVPLCNHGCTSTAKKKASQEKLKAPRETSAQSTWTRRSGKFCSDIIMCDYTLADAFPVEEIMLWAQNNRYDLVYAEHKHKLSCLSGASLGSVFTCSTSISHPSLIKFSAPVPPLCCRMTSSSVMMQFPGLCRQARAEETEGRSPPSIYHFLQAAVRL